MIQAPTIGRSLVSGTDLVLLVVISLTALLLADIGMANDGTEQRMQGPSSGPTIDAPSGNRVYRIADYADLRTRVKLQILWRKPIGGARVDVMNRGDTVILLGQVCSEALSQLAERIALRTVGVAQVENQLQVAPQADNAGAAMQPAVETPADPWISTRVAASLRFDRTINAGRIHVSTEDGVVTLSGWVRTAADKRVAAEISSDIEDVKAVTNALRVDAPPAVVDTR